MSAVGLQSSEVQGRLYKSLPQLHEQLTLFISKTSGDEGQFLHTSEMQRGSSYDLLVF